MENNPVKKPRGRQRKVVTTTQIEETQEQKVKPEKVQPEMSDNNKSSDIPEMFDFETPLDSEVKNRSYNSIEVQSEIGDVPEPSYVNEKPSFEKEDEEVDFQQPSSSSSKPKEESSSSRFSNPEMENLDAKSRKDAATQLVTTILGGYEMLLGAGASISKIKDEKIQEKIINNEIDLDIRVQIDAEGNDVNAIEYAKVHNESVDQAFAYDPEFGEKIKPAMIRVFEKKAWGVTDEQFLIAAWAQEIGLKSVMLFTLRKQGKTMLDHFATASQNHRQSMAAQPKPEIVVPDSVTTNQQKPEEPQITNIKHQSIEDIEAEMVD